MCLKGSFVTGKRQLYGIFIIQSGPGWVIQRNPSPIIFEFTENIVPRSNEQILRNHISICPLNQH